MELPLKKHQQELIVLKMVYKELKDEFEELTTEQNSQLKPVDVKSLHIKRLKEYNELRDTGLRLIQIIADEKKCKIKDVFKEMGFEMEDK